MDGTLVDRNEAEKTTSSVHANSSGTLLRNSRSVYIDAFYQFDKSHIYLIKLIQLRSFEV